MMTEYEFARQTEYAASQIGNLTDEAVGRAKDMLTQAQQELVFQLSQSPTEYSEWFFHQMLKEAERVFQDLNAQYTKLLEGDLDHVIDTVEEVIDAAAADYGLTLDLPKMSRQTLEMLTNYSPGALIKGLTDDGQKYVNTVLEQGLLGVKSPWDVQKAIAATLEKSGPFHSIAARAETIWRTEALRAYNTVSMVRYKRIDARQPGRFLKEWLHSGNTRNPRTHHQKLGGIAIPVDQKFLVGNYAADGPHDSVLPASEVIKCGCTTILVPKE